MTLLGIVLPAMLAVYALRRFFDIAVPARNAGLFLLLTLAFLHGAVFTGKLPVPVDEVARGYPWRCSVAPWLKPTMASTAPISRNCASDTSMFGHSTSLRSKLAPDVPATCGLK